MGTGTTCITDASLAGALWPGATIGPAGRPAPLRYRAGPSLADPHFLLPGDRRSAGAVLREFRSAANPSARRRLLALRAAVVATGGWPALHALEVHPGDTETIEPWVSRVLGEPTTLGIHVGPPRANRKAIVQVLDEHDRPRAVGKVATSALSSRLVEAEGQALDLLSRLELPGVRVPRLLHEGRLEDSPVLLMSHLPLRRATPSVSEERRTSAMVTLARSAGTRRMMPADSGVVARLHSAAQSIPEREIRLGCLRLLDLLSCVDEPWELGCWHGDWTGWNMAALDDEVLVWDWERFDPDVPVGWDALHYELRRDIEDRGPVAGVSGALLDRAPRLLAPFGVSPVLAPFIAAAYLVEMTVRYTADGQRAAGGRSARVEEWVIPVLDAWREGALR